VLICQDFGETEFSKLSETTSRPSETHITVIFCQSIVAAVVTVAVDTVGYCLACYLLLLDFLAGISCRP